LGENRLALTFQMQKAGREYCRIAPMLIQYK